MKKSKTKLPGRIYVRRENLDSDPTEQYLEASETTDMFQDGDEVGIYELVDLRKMKITQELV